MPELYEQQPKLESIGLRSFLIRLHSDLFRIHNKTMTYAAYFPDHLLPIEKMVMALEDRRFMTHAGIDLKSVTRELVKALMLRRHGGASTIDMQFVRTATGYKDRTIARKVYEVLLSATIQFRYSKIVILRSYISCAYFGSHLIGADSASAELYGVQSVDLDFQQASVLAAMLVYPRPLSPTAEWDARVRRRAKYGMAVYVANKKRLDKFPV